MGAIKGILVRLRALAHRDAVDRELDEEIRFHLEQETMKNERLGMSAAEARRRALATFGGVRRVQEDHREARGGRWLEDFVADTRFATRALRRAPVLSVAAIVTLALGVGANAAIFSAVNAVILQPLPLPAPDRLVMLWEENPEKGWKREVAAGANVLDWRERVRAFQDVAAYTQGSWMGTLAGDGEARLLASAEVTGNFFSVLGVSAQLGRTFRDEETWATGTRVVVVSDRAWRDQFGADPAIIGRSIDFDSRPAQVVGVMPAGFSFPYEGLDIWVPTAWKPADRAEVWFRRAHWLRPVARLRPDVSIAQADAQLQHVVAQLKREYPATNRYMGAGITPLHEFLVGDTRLPLLVLLAAVALLLLIACANVGNLLLVQAAGREREVALRLALGAGQGRVVRQALTESLVLSVAGGAAGLGVGWAGTRALVALQPEGLLRVNQYGVDWAVLGYVLAITVASGLLFGAVPAWWSRRRHPAESLKEGGRGSDGRRMRRWGDRLVVGEVALALLLTIGAGLLVRSYWSLQRVNPGFDPRGVMAALVMLPGARYDTDEKVQAFYDELLRRARQLPSVDDAALVSAVPLSGSSFTTDFIAFGRAPDEYGSEIAIRIITPDYLRTMRVPLLRGRGFTEADRHGPTPVVLINDALARSYFRGQEPVGQRIAFDRVPDSTSTWYTIVGVVGSEHQHSLAEAPKIEAVHPFAQNSSAVMTLVARTRGDPVSLAPALRRIVSELDPRLAIMKMNTMESIHARSLARERFLMALLLVFAGVGVVLAVVGVYGVLGQVARRRTREMGIRIALGAQGAQVRWLVVRHGLRLTIFGLILGTAAAALTTRAMRGLLFGVPPQDPLTFGAVAAVLALTSVVASWLPARKASRADPSLALRGE